MKREFTDRGRYATANASRYLQQLCKHFAHKVEVSHDEKSGKVVMPAGHALLNADDDELCVTLEAGDPDGLARLRDVIDSHLERFAFREGFKQMGWSREDASGARPD